MVCRDLESERLMGGHSDSSRDLTGSRQDSAVLDDVRWWEHSQAGSRLRRKKQKEIQRWLKGIPWGSYLNMPTLAAIAGL